MKVIVTPICGKCSAMMDINMKPMFAPPGFINYFCKPCGNSTLLKVETVGHDVQIAYNFKEEYKR